MRAKKHKPPFIQYNFSWDCSHVIVFGLMFCVRDVKKYEFTSEEKFWAVKHIVIGKWLFKVHKWPMVG